MGQALAAPSVAPGLHGQPARPCWTGLLGAHHLRDPKERPNQAGSLLLPLLIGKRREGPVRPAQMIDDHLGSC